MTRDVIVLVSIALFMLTGCAGASVIVADPSPTSAEDVALAEDRDIQSPVVDPLAEDDSQSTVTPELAPVYTGPIYTADIQPIFARVCSACHGPGSTAGLTLITYEGIMRGSYNGPVIVPGTADESKLVQRQLQGHYRQLSNEELALVIEWINSGAPE